MPEHNMTFSELEKVTFESDNSLAKALLTLLLEVEESVLLVSEETPIIPGSEFEYLKKLLQLPNEY